MNPTNAQSNPSSVDNSASTSSPSAQLQMQPQSQPLSSTTIKLDNIKPLTGSDNYETWSSRNQ